MAQFVTPSQLTGFYKEVYADSLQSLIPDAAKLVKLIPFSEADGPGNYFHQPVVLTHEAGVSYAGPTGGAFSLNNSIAMVTQDAQVQGYQMVLRSALSYDAASKATTNKKAFKRTTELLFENMMESATKRLEISTLYGQSGLGQTASSANASTTSTVVTLSAASWAPGIWQGEEGAQVVFYKNSDNTLCSSSTDSIFTVTSVDVDNKALTITGTTTGISALDTAIAAATQDIYFYGSVSGSTSTFANAEMVGINKILTYSGTLFNISNSTYGLWKGNTYNASSQALTFGKIVQAVAKSVNRGLNEKVTVFTSVDGWTNLATDQAALRKYDAKYGTNAENGFESLKFHSMNGEIEVMGYNLVKGGDAFVLPLKRFKRIGSQDLSFKTPGRGDDIFTQLADRAGYEVRLFTDQSVFCEAPAKCTKISSIVNAAP